MSFSLGAALHGQAWGMIGRVYLRTIFPRKKQKSIGPTSELLLSWLLTTSIILTRVIFLDLPRWLGHPSPVRICRWLVMAAVYAPTGAELFGLFGRA